MTGSERCRVDDLELDVSRMPLPPGFADSYRSRFSEALEAMQRLERGDRVNQDEDRAVGHYWLRGPAWARKAMAEGGNAIADTIEATIEQIRAFADDVRNGRIKGQAGPFQQLLLIGIGGSALGPQLMNDVLAEPGRTPPMFCFDNTDPDGLARTLAQARHAAGLGRTLAIVVSKSGGTKETRNGMLVAKQAYEEDGLAFEKHAVAITQRDSKLDRSAAGQDGGQPWVARFEMWDWVGGRTSLFSAVGLLPAALLGFDYTALCEGARRMDQATRRSDPAENPALLMAGIWHHAVNERGLANMVVLPYRDRLTLLGKYLQQLIMESLGKEGNGINVFGNKGTTDQHSYIQQLCQGRADFFAVFVRSLISEDTPAAQLCVEEGVISGDFLAAFQEGTAEALSAGGRPSIRITTDRVNAATLGAIIALFERAVGFYATMIGINAYHQPGVEAGKKAADGYIALQRKLVEQVTARSGQPFTAAEAAAAVDAPTDEQRVYDILQRLARNSRFGLKQEDDGRFTA